MRGEDGSRGGKAWDTWMMELEAKAPKTRQSYICYFNRFAEEVGASPDELYEMRLEGLRGDDPRDRLQIERRVKVMMARMRREGYSASTCQLVAKSVTSFFEAQGLPMKLKAKDMPKGQANGQRIALRELIRELWYNAPYQNRRRNRAILMIGKDSGLRISDIALLDLGDWEGAEALIDPTIRVRDRAGRAESRRVEGTFKALEPVETVKAGILAYVHVGSEAVEAVDACLEERREKGEELRPDSPLFATRDGSERMTAKAVGHVLMRMGRRLRARKVSAHSLRKFHRTMLEGAGMPEAWVKKLQGKAASVYSQPEETGELTERYVECYHALKVFEEEERLREQDERIRELEAEIARMREEEERRAEFTPMGREVVEMLRDPALIEALRAISRRQRDLP